MSSHRLWDAWARRDDGEETGLLTPGGLSGAPGNTSPLRAIWSLTQRWAQYGNLTGQNEEENAQVSGNE